MTDAPLFTPEDVQLLRDIARIGADALDMESLLNEDQCVEVASIANRLQHWIDQQTPFKTKFLFDSNGNLQQSFKDWRGIPIPDAP